MKRVIFYLLIIISAALCLCASVAAGADLASYGGARNNHQVIHVGGQVMCQDCTLGWNQWVHATKPLQGSKVSVTCLDERSRVVYYGSDLTNVAGNFDIHIDKYMYGGKELKPQNCYLRLVSSSDPVCNIATDFAGGKSGVKLGQPSVIYRDAVKFITGPFYYTTPMCDEPEHDTSTTDDDVSSQDIKY